MLPAYLSGTIISKLRSRLSIHLEAEAARFDLTSATPLFLHPPCPFLSHANRCCEPWTAGLPCGLLM